MSAPAGLVPGAIGTAVAAAIGWSPPPPFMPFAANYRGRRLPLTLGLAAGAGTLVALVAAWGGTLLSPTTSQSTRYFTLAVAVAMVFGVGAYDDRQPSRVHGLRAHGAALARGQLTSGVVKVIVVLAAGALALDAAGVSGARLVLAVPLVAGSANLFNLLDVAPGRALKWALLCAGGLLAAGSNALAWVSLGETAVLLPADVRERAMLGDAGANTIGFVLGILLAARLGLVGLATALAVVLALHAVAETISFTRVIASTPILRWFDGLGRLPADDHGTAPA